MRDDGGLTAHISAKCQDLGISGRAASSTWFAGHAGAAGNTDDKEPQEAPYQC